MLELHGLLGVEAVILSLSHTIQELLILNKIAAASSGIAPTPPGGSGWSHTPARETAPAYQIAKSMMSTQTGTAHNAHNGHPGGYHSGNHTLSKVGHHLVELLGSNRLPVTGDI